MIVTLTLNPCIDLNLEIEDFQYGTPLRALRERKRAGGKGVNVNQCLDVLAVESVAVVPLGGPGGTEFQELAATQFANRAAKVVAAQISGNTRTNVVISSAQSGRQLKVNEQGPVLSEADYGQVLDALDGYVGYGDVVALSGSLPRGVDVGLYEQLVRRYLARGAFVALDADGEAFRVAVKAKPHAVKPNREELGRWAGADLTEEGAFHTAARELAQETGGLCLATDGSRTALLATPDHLLRLVPAPAGGSPVGAGDAALAGLLASLAETGDPIGAARNRGVVAQAFRRAVACGSASASTPDTVMFTAADMRTFYEQTPEPTFL